MSLKKRGKWWYGDAQADIRDELIRQGKLNEYVPTQFADARCSCGSTQFRLRIDDREGAAIRVCTSCKVEHPIGDSEDFLEDAELEEAECVCGSGELEITVGVALYEDSDDVRWLYVGCRCPSCGLTGCFGDWKNEYQDYRELLARI
jgi:hypothetical protein